MVNSESMTFAMPPKRPKDPFANTEKIMQAFRLPREVVQFLKEEAEQVGLAFSALVLRYLEGLRTWFGLPKAATALLEADRQILGFTRYEYILHLLFERSLELREKGPGFDAERVENLRRR